MNFVWEFSLILAVLYAYYRIILVRLSNLTWNRLILLMMVPLAALLAFIEFELALPLPTAAIILEPISVGSISPGGTPDPASSFSLSAFFYNAYLVGVFLFLSLWVKKILQLRQFIKGGQKRKTPEGLTMIFHSKAISPASFFFYVFWPKSYQPEAAEKEMIMKHETAHAREWHSLDRLIMDLFSILFWFHPLVYAIRKDLVLTHEYLADRAASRHHNFGHYAEILLKQTLEPAFQPVHSFIQSPIKGRIRMLKTIQNPRKDRWIYLTMLPVLGMLTLFFACQDASIPTQDVQFSPDNAVSTASTSSANQQTKPDPDISVYMEVDEEPKPLNLRDIYMKIGYPEEAKKKGLEGQVVVRVLIDHEGTYERHEIIKSGGEVLDTAIEAHLEKLLFEPAMKDGKSVKFWVNIPFVFKLED